jgi:TusA-related sulfurtransferase
MTHALKKGLFLGLATILVFALSATAGDTPAKGCCMAQGDVQREVATIEGGVRITLTAKDPATVAKLQANASACPREGCQNCPMHAEGVTRTVEKTETGVVITATATDPSLVAALQQHATATGCRREAAGTQRPCCKAKAAHAACQRGNA